MRILTLFFLMATVLACPAYAERVHVEGPDHPGFWIERPGGWLDNGAGMGGLARQFMDPTGNAVLEIYVGDGSEWDSRSFADDWERGGKDYLGLTFLDERTSDTEMDLQPGLGILRTYAGRLQGEPLTTIILYAVHEGTAWIVIGLYPDAVARELAGTVERVVRGFRLGQSSGTQAEAARPAPGPVQEQVPEPVQEQAQAAHVQQERARLEALVQAGVLPRADLDRFDQEHGLAPQDTRALDTETTEPEPEPLPDIHPVFPEPEPQPEPEPEFQPEPLPGPDPLQTLLHPTPAQPEPIRPESTVQPEPASEPEVLQPAAPEPAIPMAQVPDQVESALDALAPAALLPDARDMPAWRLETLTLTSTKDRDKAWGVYRPAPGKSMRAAKVSLVAARLADPEAAAREVADDQQGYAESYELLEQEVRGAPAFALADPDHPAGGLAKAELAYGPVLVSVEMELDPGFADPRLALALADIVLSRLERADALLAAPPRAEVLAKDLELELEAQGKPGKLGFRVRNLCSEPRDITVLLTADQGSGFRLSSSFALLSRADEQTEVVIKDTPAWGLGQGTCFVDVRQAAVSNGRISLKVNGEAGGEPDAVRVAVLGRPELQASEFQAPEAQAKALQANLTPKGLVRVHGQAYRVFEGSGGMLVTDAQGVIQTDPELAFQACRAARLYEVYAGDLEQDFLREQSARVDDFLAVEGLAQAALLVRGAASQALVDVGVLYLTGDPQALGGEALKRATKDIAGDALKDAAMSMLTEPDTYLRVLAKAMLDKVRTDLAECLERCQGLDQNDLDAAALAELDAKALSAYAAIVPGMTLMQGLRPEADVLNQVQDVLGSMGNRLLEHIPGGSRALDAAQGQSVLLRAAGAIDEIYGYYKPYADYAAERDKYAAMRQDKLEQDQDLVRELVARGLAMAEGCQVYRP